MDCLPFLIDLAEAMSDKGIKHLFLYEDYRLLGWERPEFPVVFTSSSMLVIDHSIGDLSRRVSMHNLPVLPLREFLMFEGHDSREPLKRSDLQKQTGR